MIRMIVAVVIGRFIYDFTVYTIAYIQAVRKAMKAKPFRAESREEDDLK